MSDMIPDLSKTLAGHIVKWCKKHYPGRTFDDVVTAYTGWTGKHGERQKCIIMMEALILSKQGTETVMRDFVETFFFHAARDANQVTSYHVSGKDVIKAECFTKALESALQNLVVNKAFTAEEYDKQIYTPIVILPETMPESAFERSNRV